MSCRFTEIGGATIALLLVPPNYDNEIKVSSSLPADVQRTLSRREKRRNFARSFRYSLEYTIDTSDSKESADLRMWLLRLKGETVAVPIWTDYVEIAASFVAGATVLPIAFGAPVRYGSEWIILSEDTNTWEIVTVSAVAADSITLSGGGATLNWPASTRIFPLLFGKLGSPRPTFDATTDEILDGTIKIEDNSPFDRRLTAAPGSIPVVGDNVPEFATLPLLSIAPDHVRVLDTMEVDVIERVLGFLRETQTLEYPQANARSLEMEFACTTRAEIAAVERFFANRLGSAKKFMVPTFRGDLRLLTDLPDAGDASLLPIEASRYTDLDYATAHPSWPYLALVDRSSGDPIRPTIEPLRVDEIDIDGVHLLVPVGVAHAKEDTKVSHLLLARFADSVLQWTYTTDDLATARLKFVELPSDYADPQPDVPEPMYLYRFTENTPTPIVSCFTNYENGRTYGDQTFLPAPFEHKGITISLRPGETKTEIVSWGGDFTGNPLGKIMPFDLEGDLFVEILEGDAGNPDAPLITRFKGDVMNLTKKGPDWTSECVWAGKMFKRKVPHFLVQKSDNFLQFTRPTKLDRGPFRYGATIESIDTARTTLVCGPLGGSPDPTGTDDNVFGNGGFLEIGAGANFTGRAILHSSCAGGHLTIVIDRPLRDVFTPGAVFNLWPGYDGSKAQCDSRYANGQYFGGSPFITDTGPQIKAAETKQVGGGKKG